MITTLTSPGNSDTSDDGSEETAAVEQLRDFCEQKAGAVREGTLDKDAAIVELAQAGQNVQVDTRECIFELCFARACYQDDQFSTDSARVDAVKKDIVDFRRLSS